MAHRGGVYFVPVRSNLKGELEVALLKYTDGFGFVGGGIEDNETVENALSRELFEELGEDVSRFGSLYKVSEPYAFTMPADKRPNVKAHTEKHYFFIAQVRGNHPPIFKETGAVVKWLPFSRLYSKEITPYEELRSYIVLYLMPAIQTYISKNP